MVYLEHIKNTFRTQFRYKMNWGMRLFGTVISVFLQICLWNSLLVNQENVIDMKYMLGYILASAMIQSLTMGDTINKVNGQIYSGQIAMNMIKPIKFRMYIFCESLGGSLFSFIFQYLPVTLIMTVIYEAYEVWIGIDIWFVLSTFLGIYLYFSLAYCLALTSFWWGQTWILGRFLNDFINLFSGKIIPVMLFPGFLLSISQCLPFQYIYYTPIAMLLNQLTLHEKLFSIGLQIGWCVLFTFLGNYIERRGTYKLQVQGG